MTKFLAVALMVVTFTFGAVVVVGQQTGSGSQGALLAQAATTTTIPGVYSCASGTRDVNIYDEAVTKGEGSAFTALGNAGNIGPITTTAGPSGTGFFVVTLSGEASMSGASPLDHIDISVRLDGANLQPKPHTQFHSGEAVNSHAAVFCAPRVLPGEHTVQVLWRVIDVAPYGTVTGTIDDFAVQF